jgi:hypothetical protein
MLAVGGMPRSTTIQVAPACLNDSRTIFLWKYIMGMATGTDTGSARRRKTWHIPRVGSPDNVMIVKDTASICRRAHTAYMKTTGGDTLTGPPVDVIWVRGTHAQVYVVTDRRRHVGEFNLEAVFDTNFIYLAGMAD